MRLGSLFSGGKDSTFAIHTVQQQGHHDVVVLLSVSPKSAESHLLHHPNIKWTRLQAASMNLPQLVAESDSDDTDQELLQMEVLLKSAKEEFDIEGIVHGGMKSNFQKEKFETVCERLGLSVLAPLWNIDAEKYMQELLDSNFSFIITSVSSGGLDDSWLGRKVTRSDLLKLKILSERFGFNLNFEGGEAETFVVNCPMFSSFIEMKKSKKTWDGYRGMLEIMEAELNHNA